jgi:hypothetical protein
MSISASISGKGVVVVVGGSVVVVEVVVVVVGGSVVVVEVVVVVSGKVAGGEVGGGVVGEVLVSSIEADVEHDARSSPRPTKAIFRKGAMPLPCLRATRQAPLRPRVVPQGCDLRSWPSPPEPCRDRLSKP